MPPLFLAYKDTPSAFSSKDPEWKCSKVNPNWVPYAARALHQLPRHHHRQHFALVGSPDPAGDLHTAATSPEDEEYHGGEERGVEEYPLALSQRVGAPASTAEHRALS